MKRLIISMAMMVFLVLGVSMILPGSAQAAIAPGCKNSVLGLPVWYEYLEVGPNADDPCAFLPIPPDAEFNWGRALPRIGLAIIDILLRVVGLIAVAFTIYGGVRYILSQGEPEATKKAKGTIVGASVGLIIALFAATLVGFIGSTLWK